MRAHNRLALLALCASFVGTASFAADWKQGGRLYGESPHCGSAHRSIQSVKIRLDPGKVIDKSQGGGSIACCGGEENGNHNSTSIPSGVKVTTSGGDQGEWGILSVNLAANADDIDDDGKVKAWTVQAELYCGPSCAVGKGGCNVNLTPSIAQK